MNSIKYLLNLINVLGYNRGESSVKLKDKISQIYGNPNVYITKNGRSAIYLFLKSLNLPEGSKVAIQAFTCNAVVNPILSLGLEPIYIDIRSDNFSMDLSDLEKKIDESVKVLILQHTFGIQGDEKIYEYCLSKGIIVLNDCAHTLGIKEIGQKGDATMLSFGLEKMLSSRVGGALIINNPKLIDVFSNIYNPTNYISKTETFKWLINPLIWRMIRVFKLSDETIIKLKKVGILKSGFEEGEGDGIANYSSLQNISPVLAGIVLDCLVDLEENIGHRKSIVNRYVQSLNQKYESALIRYPYITKDEKHRDILIKKISELGYPISDRWYFPVVFPKSTNLNAMKYTLNSCPNAEKLSNIVINLPTDRSVDTDRAESIIEIVKQ